MLKPRFHASLPRALEAYSGGAGAGYVSAIRRYEKQARSLLKPLAAAQAPAASIPAIQASVPEGAEVSPILRSATRRTQLPSDPTDVDVWRGIEQAISHGFDNLIGRLPMPGWLTPQAPTGTTTSGRQ